MRTNKTREAMNMNLTIHDENLTGSTLNLIRLKIGSRRMAVKELIRMRVYKEVKDFNTRRTSCYRGLVQPQQAEPVLNGFVPRRKSKLNAEEMYRVALAAFEKHEYTIYIDDNRVDNPEQHIEVGPHTQVSFLRR